ncbi:MAG: hypothetical protein OHK0038_09430 [Flammeovirgaceae bacterium]
METESFQSSPSLEEIENDWKKVREFFRENFNKLPDINSVIFMIGVRELGKGKKHFSKEEKQDLMHIAICKILSYSGYYELEGLDADGWPHWKPLQKVPFLDVINQEKFLKMHIAEYFRKEGLIN